MSNKASMVGAGILAVAVVLSVCLCAWACSCRGGGSKEGFKFAPTQRAGTKKSGAFGTVYTSRPPSAAVHQNTNTPTATKQQEAPNPLNQMVYDDKTKPLGLACPKGHAESCRRIIKARGGNDANVRQYDTCRSGAYKRNGGKTDKEGLAMCNEKAMNGSF